MRNKNVISGVFKKNSLVALNDNSYVFVDFNLSGTLLFFCFFLNQVATRGQTAEEALSEGGSERICSCDDELFEWYKRNICVSLKKAYYLYLLLPFQHLINGKFYRY